MSWGHDTTPGYSAGASGAALHDILWPTQSRLGPTMPTSVGIILRNYTPEPLTLRSEALSEGSWMDIATPPKSIPKGKAAAWIAGGRNTVKGEISFSIGSSGAWVTIEFKNEPAIDKNWYQIYTNDEKHFHTWFNGGDGRDPDLDVYLGMNWKEIEAQKAAAAQK